MIEDINISCGKQCPNNQGLILPNSFTGIERWKAGLATFLCSFHSWPFNTAILGPPMNLVKSVLSLLKLVGILGKNSIVWISKSFHIFSQLSWCRLPGLSKTRLTSSGFKRNNSHPPLPGSYWIWFNIRFRSMDQKSMHLPNKDLRCQGHQQWGVWLYMHNPNLFRHW